MKKQLLLLSSAFVCFAANMAAQPTITATGTNPMVGDVVVLNQGNYASPGSAGANQTWDLSAIGTGTGQTTTMVTPSSTPNGSSFSSSNVCASPGSGYYSYYTTSASAWQNAGVVGPSGTIPYNDKEDLLRFPCTYNSTYTDAFAANWTSSGYPAYRSGNVIVTADGYGTLTTPAGTYSNVMRVHFHEIYKDSIDFGGFPVVYTYDNDEYMWYLNGNRTPIAAVYTMQINGSPTSVGFYKPTVTVGIDEDFADSPLFSAFPSPAVNEVTITVKDFQPQSIELNDISGKRIAMIDPLSVVTDRDSYKLDVSSYATGIYFIRLINQEGTTATRKLVITK
jgi:hypothetical protein